MKLFSRQHVILLMLGLLTFFTIVYYIKRSERELIPATVSYDYDKVDIRRKNQTKHSTSEDKAKSSASPTSNAPVVSTHYSDVREKVHYFRNISLKHSSLMRLLKQQLYDDHDTAGQKFHFACARKSVLFNGTQLDDENNEDVMNYMISVKSGSLIAKKMPKGNPLLCQKKSAYLTIVILTRMGNKHLRNHIRNSWGAIMYVRSSIGLKSVNYLFLLMDGGMESKDFESEAHQYRDIILPQNLPDRPTETDSLIAGLEYLTYKCDNSTDYVGLVYDTMFVDVPGLVQYLIDYGHKYDIRQPTDVSPLFCGLVVNRPVRQESSPWYVPESLWPSKKYPIHCDVGKTGLFTSMGTIERLLSCASIHKSLPDYNVLFGAIVAKSASIPVKDIRRTKNDRERRMVPSKTDLSNKFRHLVYIDAVFQPRYVWMDMLRASMISYYESQK